MTKSLACVVRSPWATVTSLQPSLATYIRKYIYIYIHAVQWRENASYSDAISSDASEPRLLHPCFVTCSNPYLAYVPAPISLYMCHKLQKIMYVRVCVCVCVCLQWIAWQTTWNVTRCFSLPTIIDIIDSCALLVHAKIDIYVYIYIIAKAVVHQPCGNPTEEPAVSATHRLQLVQCSLTWRHSNQVFCRVSVRSTKQSHPIFGLFGCHGDTCL